MAYYIVSHGLRSYFVVVVVMVSTWIADSSVSITIVS